MGKEHVKPNGAEIHARAMGTTTNNIPLTLNQWDQRVL